ncbi:DNA-binding protein [Talaromyces pinophilus]|uniref:DNA-binding protein n=1 Tax=Talaromyces pinophilus TaxID=128442 RepID=A0A6V8H8Q3_TALPI|nr:DNA-binding protein [Talaromyces pinophilus]
MSGGQPARIRRWWNEEEDRILREAVAAQAKGDSFNDWNAIALKLPGRSNKDCRKRWAKICTNVKKGAWDVEEDKRLWAAVKRHGLCWTEVAQEVQTRHADQCAKRWQHSLNPSVLHTKWEAEDDQKLLRAVEEFGRSWTRISEKRFPTRSPTDIKNRHALLLRRHQAEWRKTCELELNMGIEDAMETDECSDEMASNANESDGEDEEEKSPGNERISDMSPVTPDPSRKDQINEHINNWIIPDQSWIQFPKENNHPIDQENDLAAQNISLAWDDLNLTNFATAPIVPATTATMLHTDPLMDIESFTSFLPGPSKTEPKGDELPSTLPSSPSGSKITLVIYNLKPPTLGVILDTLYRDGAVYKLDVQR